jgi:DNA-binding response OmpR family regulator
MALFVSCEASLHGAPAYLVGHSPLVLIIEDDVRLASDVARHLQVDGYDVVAAHDGKAGLKTATTQSVDLVLLDLILPDITGFEVLRHLRALDRRIPVIVVSVLAEEADKVACFRLGADDYVTKPFFQLELLERIRARLRHEPPGAKPLSDGRVMLDPAQRVVRIDNHVLALSPKEFDLLHCLLRARGAVLSHEELLEHVWKIRTRMHARRVEYQITQLRHKLEPFGLETAIVTVSRRGFAWRHPAAQ